MHAANLRHLAIALTMSHGSQSGNAFGFISSTSNSSTLKTNRHQRSPFPSRQRLAFSISQNYESHYGNAFSFPSFTSLILNDSGQTDTNPAPFRHCNLNNNAKLETRNRIWGTLSPFLPHHFLIAHGKQASQNHESQTRHARSFCAIIFTFFFLPPHALFLNTHDRHQHSAITSLSFATIAKPQVANVPREGGSSR